MNETHLCKDDTINTSMLGFDDRYIMFRKDRNNNGGCVMVLVHKDVNPKHIVTHIGVEALIIQVKYNSEHIYVISVYQSQNHPVNTWVNDMTCLINIYLDRKLCVVGDLNEDISSGDASLPKHSMFVK